MCAVCVLRVRMCACVRVCFMCVLALRRPSFDTVLVYRVGHVLCSKHLFTYMYHIHFFSTSAIFSVPAAGHSLRCRARRGPACALGASLGPGRAPWRGLWAFLQSRSIWQVMTRSLSDPPSQARPWKPPKCHFCFIFRPVAVSATSTTPVTQNVYAWTQPRYNSSRASSFKNSRCGCNEHACVCHRIEPIERIIQQAV